MTASIAAGGLPTRLFRWGLKWQLHSGKGETATIVALVPVLLIVALWNGFPLIYYDTGAYVLEGLGHHFLVERSPVYSLFLRFAGGGVSLWLIVVLQALATSFTIVECARVLAPRLDLGGFMALLAILVLATGLPWYVGEVEPDCLASVAVLSAYLLAFHGPRLGRSRTIAILAIGSFAAAAHTSHLLLAFVILAFLAFAAAVRRFILRRGTGLSASIVKPAAMVALAASLVLSSNVYLTGRAFVSRAGPDFLFARLLQDRIVLRLLEDTCPGAHYRLCAYKDFLPPTANAWLWAPYSPFFKLGGFEGTREESERIVRDSIARYPLLNLQSGLADGVRQFFLFQTGDQIEPQQWAIEPMFTRYLHTQVPPYLAARQQEGTIAFRFINLVDVPFGYLSLAAAAVLLAFCLARARREDAAFLGLLLMALAANALICGALSNPHARYQSRLIWLAPFAVALVGARHAPDVAAISRRNRHDPSANPSTA